MHIINCSSDNAERGLTSLARRLSILHSVILGGNTPPSNSPEKNGGFLMSPFPFDVAKGPIETAMSLRRGDKRFNGGDTRNIVPLCNKPASPSDLSVRALTDKIHILQNSLFKWSLAYTLTFVAIIIVTFRTFHQH